MVFFRFFDKKNPASKGGKRTKDPMEDIFGVSGGYAPYLGTGPGTINGPFEMENDYDSPSTSRDSAATNGIDRRGSLSNNRQSPTGENFLIYIFQKTRQIRSLQN